MLPQLVALAAGREPTPVAFLLRVVVELDVKQRAQRMFRATLIVRDHAGSVVLRREVGRTFHGRVPSELPFAVALPKGDYALELGDRWQPLRAKATVGDRGGEVRFPRRE